MAVFLGGLFVYIGTPLLLLREFFRSAWVPRELKDLVGWTLGVLLLLFGGLVFWTRHKVQSAHQSAVHQRHFQPVRLTVQLPGLLPFLLGRGGIEEVRFDSVRQLVVSGDLSVGGRLQARFSTSPGFAGRNKTNVVAVSTDAGTATQAKGQSVYDPSARTVSGTFDCVLPGGRHLSGSFPSTPVVLSPSQFR